MTITCTTQADQKRNSRIENSYRKCLNNAEVIADLVYTVNSSTDSKNLYLDFPELTTSGRSPESEKRALRSIS